MKTIIASLFLLNVAAATLPQISITKWGGKLDQLHLSGIASQFQLSKQKRIYIEMYPYEDGLMLTYGDQQKFIENYPAELANIENLLFSDVNINLDKNAISFSAKTINFDESIVKEIELKCSVEANYQDLPTQALHSCTKDSTANISKLKIDSKKESPLFDFIENVLDAKGATELEKIDWANDNHQFKLKAKIKLKFSVAATIKGSIHYQENKKRISIKVNSAYAVFISITNKLFEELEKMSSEKLVVDKPYIHIYL